ncbi:MAG: hypothetical protein U0U70_15265 [Chitinophagaceae bacterium]
MKKSIEHLHEAADILIKKMRTPEACLKMLTDSINWVHDYELNERTDRNNSNVFSFNLWINEIVIPWLNSKENPKDAIVSGFNNLLSYYGSDGHNKMAKELFAAYVLSVQEYGIGSTEYTNMCSDWLLTVLEIGNCLSNHVYILEQTMKQAS